MEREDYIGDLDPDLMKYYQRQVQKGKDDLCRGMNSVFFNGDHVIKYPRVWQTNSTLNSILIKEYFIGNDLISNGIGSPQMYAVMFGKDSEIPFLVIEKLNLIPFNWIKKLGAKKHFSKNLNQVEGLGYDVGNDCYANNIALHNCGFDKKKGFCFFDFENWAGNRVDELVNGMRR